MTANVNTGSELKDSLVVCHSSQGVEFRASLMRLTRYLAVIEIHSPGLVLRTSEVLTDFKIVIRDRIVYSGRAVVSNMVNAGSALVCEVSLNDGAWTDVEFSPAYLRDGHLSAEFTEFLQDWQKLYRIDPEYKVIIADMQSFLTDLRLWLEQVELGIRSSPSEDRVRLEMDVADELTRPVIPCVNVLFEKFERIAIRLDPELLPAHRNFMRRQLHPLVLCAPFAYRTFTKPLGYAGDYEMVNMIIRNTHEGASLFAKIVNTWFLRQPPAEAHRNRITYLVRKLRDETLRVRGGGRLARVCSVACGPAKEVRDFIADDFLSDHTSITLLDFNEETLQYLQGLLALIKKRSQRRTPLEFIKRSVHHILKESGRSVERAADSQYDFVYCAGLFDYLSDTVCQRLMNVMYDWVAPGGLLVATNVEPSNPLRHGMEHLLDWHLIYRTAAQMRKLKPLRAPEDSTRVETDATGVNVLLEVRKPGHA